MWDCGFTYGRGYVIQQLNRPCLDVQNFHTIRALASMDENTLSQEDVWLKRYSRAIPIWFQGLWDTVGALGVPGPLIPRVSKDDFAFLETDLRINYTHAYHALAIDEHRQAFAPTLWVKNTPKQGDTYPARDLAHYAQEASTEELELCRQHPRRIRQAKRRAVEPR